MNLITCDNVVVTLFSYFYVHFLLIKFECPEYSFFLNLFYWSLENVFECILTLMITRQNLPTLKLFKPKNQNDKTLMVKSGVGKDLTYFFFP